MRIAWNSNYMLDNFHAYKCRTFYQVIANVR